MKLVDRIGDDQDLHRSMLAYASDYPLIGTTTFPHGISYLQPNVQMASLDHAMWFHRPFRVDDWLLVSCAPPSAPVATGTLGGNEGKRAGS